MISSCGSRLRRKVKAARSTFEANRKQESPSLPEFHQRDRTYPNFVLKKKNNPGQCKQES